MVAVLALTVQGALASHSAPQIISPSAGAAVASNPLTVSGTVASDAVLVRVYDGVTPVGDTGVTNGFWTVAVPLADGAHTLKAAAKDAGGFWSADSASVAVTVDTVAPAAPTITAPSSGSLLAFSTFAIDGIAEPRARVDLTLSTGSVFTATASTGGAWSISRTWPDAAYSVSARATDAAGNPSLASPATTFTVDTIAPVAPRIDIPADGMLTNQTAITFTGAAEPGSTVTLSEGAAIGSGVVGPSGSWSFTGSFGGGIHSVSARAVDAAGNAGPSSPATTFTVDLTAPGAPDISGPVEGSVIASQMIVVEGTAEAGSTVQVIRNTVVIATAAADGSGAWSVRLASLPGGAIALSARAKDRAGNLGSPSALRNFMVDATPPTIAVTTSDGAIFTPLNLPKIDGIAADNIGVREVILDFYDVTGRGVASFHASCGPCPGGGNVQWTATQTPLVGRFVVRAYARDMVGNRSDFAELSVTIVRTS